MVFLLMLLWRSPHGKSSRENIFSFQRRRTDSLARIRLPAVEAPALGVQPVSDYLQTEAPALGVQPVSDYLQTEAPALGV